MTQLLTQHQVEIEHNRLSWEKKPLLQKIYTGFYDRIMAWVDQSIPGRVVEIGSGIGQLKSHLPQAIATDLFANPWLDLVCDGYQLPFPRGSLSHLVLFDVFHHLETPGVFLKEARRVLARQGRLILFEPYVSWLSLAVYGLFHHEPIGWTRQIRTGTELVPSNGYYAAQGNATRIFFQDRDHPLLRGWSVLHSEAFASLSYLLSGGFSKPAFYSGRALPVLRQLDEQLSNWPQWFGARCLVALQAQ